MILRPYQQTAAAEIHQAWRSHRNVLAVLPTGAGKTVLFGNILAAHQDVSFAIAHRQELVSQICMALGKFGVEHNIIAPRPVRNWIMNMQAAEYGRPYISPHAQCFVAGVDTLLARKDKLAHIAARATLWVQDEAHHLLRSNKWGKAAAMMPHAKGLGVTATPIRADGRGLGSHNDSIFDAMVTGPSMRDLIRDEYLTDYRIYAPPSTLDLSGVAISKATGDYSRNKLVATVRKSKIMGDIVNHYRRYAAGKLGVTFVTDVETAHDVSKQFNAAGVPAEAVSAKTPGPLRQQIISKFRRRELLQLVNVDLFGEGFDLPAIESVSMARPTESYGLYCQQFGRGLRPMDGKSHAIIIDHVGNVSRHGLPDAPRQWSLEPRERRSNGKRDPDMIPVKTCQACTGVYEAYYKACPFCGHVIEPAQRSAPEFVDGDLTELTPEVLAAMRAEVDRIDGPDAAVRMNMERSGAPAIVAAGAAKQHRLRQEAQAALRESISWWAGHQKHAGHTDAEGYRKFYYKFGIDVLSAQALGRPAAENLNERINNDIRPMGQRSQHIA